MGISGWGGGYVCITCIFRIPVLDRTILQHFSRFTRSTHVWSPPNANGKSESAAIFCIVSDLCKCSLPHLFANVGSPDLFSLMLMKTMYKLKMNKVSC